MRLNGQFVRLPSSIFGFHSKFIAAVLSSLWPLTHIPLSNYLPLATLLSFNFPLLSFSVYHSFRFFDHDFPNFVSQAFAARDIRLSHTKERFHGRRLNVQLFTGNSKPISWRKFSNDVPWSPSWPTKHICISLVDRDNFPPSHPRLIIADDYIEQSEGRAGEGKQEQDLYSYRATILASYNTSAPHGSSCLYILQKFAVALWRWILDTLAYRAIQL